MKIFIKNKASVIFAMILLSLSFLLLPGISAAAEESSSQFQYIYDDAGLLSSSEVTDLEEMSAKYSEEVQTHIMILTHNDPDAVNAEKYIEDFYDKTYPGDAVILLIDMHNRVVFIEGYGLAETYIHSKRADVIREEITPYLSDADYVSAFDLFIEKSAEYMQDDSDLNYDHDYSYSSDPNNAYSSDSNNNYSEDYGYSSGSGYNSEGEAVANVLTNIWFQLAAAVIIGAVSVTIMAYNAGGKMTVSGNTYMDPNHSGLIGRRDDYIRTQVTRVRKPQNNSGQGGGFNAGGFRGGISSGGHSHSSSGGKF
jgi:uncharacterized protein